MQGAKAEGINGTLSRGDQLAARRRTGVCLTRRAVKRELIDLAGACLRQEQQGRERTTWRAAKKSVYTRSSAPCPIAASACRFAISRGGSGMFMTWHPMPTAPLLTMQTRWPACTERWACTQGGWEGRRTRRAQTGSESSMMRQSRKKAQEKRREGSEGNKGYRFRRKWRVQQRKEQRAGRVQERRERG